MAAYTCHPSYKGKPKWKDRSPGQPGHKARPYLKINLKQKGCHDSSSMVSLFSKHKALSSNPSTEKKKIILTILNKQ
jgi:hypothetical protein